MNGPLEPEAVGGGSRVTFALGALALLLLAGVTVFAILHQGDGGGKTTTDFKNLTITHETGKEDVFKVLNSLKAEREDVLAAWLKTKRYVSVDDVPALREAGYYKADDAELVGRFRTKVPEIDTSRNAEEQFNEIRVKMTAIGKDAVVSQLRKLSRTGDSPFQFLGDTFKAASPDYPGSQPLRGEVIVRTGSELQRALEGKVARFYNKESNRSLDLKVKAQAINADVDIWFNKSQFCRLGLSQAIEPIEVGLSPLTYANYRPEVADAHYATSRLGSAQCANLISTVASER